MTLEEFTKMVQYRIETYCPEYYLVHMRERYAHEKEWQDFNILFCFNQDTCKYEWEWDFWEGQEYVEVLGFIDLDDIEVPDYNGEGR